MKKKIIQKKKTNKQIKQIFTNNTGPPCAHAPID